MSEQNVETLRAQINALNRGDLDSWLEGFDPEAEFIMPSEWPDHQKGRGREAALASMQTALDVAEDVRIEVLDITELDSDRIFVSTHVTARGVGSGVSLGFDRYDLISMRAGKVIRAETFLDR